MEGSLTMLIVCITVCYVILGTYGILLGISATLAEKIPGIDDNSTLLIGTLVYMHPSLFDVHQIKEKSQKLIGKRLHIERASNFKEQTTNKKLEYLKS